MLQNNEAFSFFPGFLSLRASFQEEVLHLVHYLSAPDFIYPKILVRYII